MPRGRRRKSRSKPVPVAQPDYPAVHKNEMDSGETIDPSEAPIDVAEVFADDEDDASLDPWGDQERDKEGPPPQAAPNIPEPSGSQPEQMDYQPPRLAEVSFEGGDHLKFPPITQPNVVDDRRIHLTWVVSSVAVRTKSVDNMVRPEIVVEAMLCAAIYDMVPLAQQERKEPMLQVQPLMAEPVELGLPLWLLPAALVQNPDQISLSHAEKLLAQMFASFPTEIIKTPPPPAEMEKIPDWLLKKMKEQKGPMRP